jgi:hypothetical protein
MTLHPGFRVLARFDEPVRGWQGALQSAYSDAFEREGITLMALFVPTGCSARRCRASGPSTRATRRTIDHLAMFGGSSTTRAAASVHRSIGREPLVTYRMAPRTGRRSPA